MGGLMFRILLNLLHYFAIKTFSNLDKSHIVEKVSMLYIWPLSCDRSFVSFVTGEFIKKISGECVSPICFLV